MADVYKRQSVNRYLIDGIAKAGSGEAFVVTEPSQASDTARDFSTYIQSPVMTGINVSFDGFDVYDVDHNSRDDSHRRPDAAQRQKEVPPRRVQISHARSAFV